MAASNERTPMGRVDKAWFDRDSETNLMVINGVMLFDEPVDFEELCTMFEQRMVKPFPRFRQRVVEVPPGSGRVFWEPDPFFDIRSHLLHIALPHPGCVNTLQSLVGDLCSTSLDRTKALWQVYQIDNVNGGCAVFARFHHCIADGIALIQVMLSMTSNDARSSLMPVLEPDNEPVKTRHSTIGSAAKRAVRTSLSTAALTISTVKTGVDLTRNPEQVVRYARATGIVTAASAAVLARLLLIAPDRKSVYRGELGVAKRVVWSEPIALARIKASGRAGGGTVNDVLIAALTGTLRAYMIAQGDDPDAGDLRALVPVNLRDPTRALKLGNEFGLVFLALPISVEDPLRRMYEVKRRMDVIKQSPEAIVAYQVLKLLGALPGGLASWAADLFMSKASAVLTNVPGPQETLFFAGRPIRKLMFWVPQSGDIGMGISIISYNGNVLLGIIVDEKLCPNPERMIEGFVREFDILAEVSHAISTPLPE